MDGDGVHQVVGRATDRAGNESTETLSDIKIDKTAPDVSFDQAGAPSYFHGEVPVFPCTATDPGLVDGSPGSGVDQTGCVVGPPRIVGTDPAKFETTVEIVATAVDEAGNSRSVTRNYVVRGWSIQGFSSPVDLGKVVNTVKGGSTVPLKFKPFGSAEIKTVEAVRGGAVAIKPVPCQSGLQTDALVGALTGAGSPLAYDAVGGHFVQHWKTPKTTGCYTATLTTASGSWVSALFQVKQSDRAVPGRVLLATAGPARHSAPGTEDWPLVKRPSVSGRSGI